jgi:hypothetical protein
MTEIRPEVVAALVAGRIVDAAELDPTSRELAAAGDTLADLAKSELQAAGKLAPEATVYNLRLDDLEILAAVWAVVGKWRSPYLPGDRRLSDALKILPGDVVHDTLRVLAIGGYVPWTDVPEPPPCDG